MVEETEWIPVTQRTGSCNNRNNNNKVISCFFTNFPGKWVKQTLWGIFAKHEEVADVYIARKKTKEVDAILSPSLMFLYY